MAHTAEKQARIDAARSHHTSRDERRRNACAAFRRSLDRKGWQMHVLRHLNQTEAKLGLPLTNAPQAPAR